jgi:Ala-tRNA(Pro) deacylase
MKMSEQEQKIYKALDDLGVTYEKYEHPAFATCDSSGTFYKDNDMGVDCKNIFLQNRRGKKHYLVVLLADKKLDIPHLAEFLDEHKKMGFASEGRLNKYLGLTPGSVTPLAIINQNARDIPVVLDKEIFDYEYVHFHPSRNTASIKITTDDLMKFCKMYACDVKIY